MPPPVFSIPPQLPGLAEDELAAIRQIAGAHGLPVALARVLWSRGLCSPEEIRTFLTPSPESLHDPFEMLGMEPATRRLKEALLRQEPILIYGDYDVDGTVATVLLKTALERVAVSLSVTPEIRYHIPHRIREGYGMRETRIADAAAEGVRLVISVDTGIRAFAAAEEAARCGLDLIVTDHHLPDSAGGVPRALAVLNPNQPGCAYPCKELCGAGVAFKLAQALLEGSARNEAELQRIQSKTLPSFLKLLAIATIADSVPLVGENRVIAALGLLALRQPAQSGLRTLMQLAGIDLSRPVSAADVGFRLGPRINAAGRMDIASDVVELFLSRDGAVASALAEKLHALNEDRRATERKAVEEIDLRLEALTADGAALPTCLVLDDTVANRWHRGVIGILASRVVERTGRPALVLTHDAGEAHGSGRSVAGFHLLDALTAAHASADGALFLRFGGHAHAAGFALPSERVDLLRQKLEHYAACLGTPQLNVSPQCDAEVLFSELNQDFFRTYEQFAPFGHGHTEPLFLARSVELCAEPRVIKDRHVSLRLKQRGAGPSWKATAWSRRTVWAQRAQSEAWQQGCCFDVLFRLSRNWHPEFGGWELEIEEMYRVAV